MIDVKGDPRTIRIRSDPWEGTTEGSATTMTLAPLPAMGQRDRYMSGHGVWVDDARPGIKVYFEAEGRLRADGCPGEEPRGFPVKKMRGWRSWAINEHEGTRLRYMFDIWTAAD